MGSNELKWEMKVGNWALGLGVALSFMVVFGLLFEDYVTALAIGLALGVVLIPFGEKYSVAINDGTLTYDAGDGESRVPVSKLAALRQEPKADVLVLEFVDGAKIAIDTGGDEAGVAEFVEQVHNTPELSHIG